MCVHVFIHSAKFLYGTRAHFIQIWLSLDQSYPQRSYFQVSSCSELYWVYKLQYSTPFSFETLEISMTSRDSVCSIPPSPNSTLGHSFSMSTISTFNSLTPLLPQAAQTMWKAISKVYLWYPPPKSLFPLSSAPSVWHISSLVWSGFLLAALLWNFLELSRLHRRVINTLKSM